VRSADRRDRPTRLAGRIPRHYHGAEELPPPSELRIVQYDGNHGFYLFYCDDRGRELTDTYHETLGGALSQAEWEFRVAPEEWEVCD
jgi:hypothetical protein